VIRFLCQPRTFIEHWSYAPYFCCAVDAKRQIMTEMFA